MITSLFRQPSDLPAPRRRGRRRPKGHNHDVSVHYGRRNAVGRHPGVQECALRGHYGPSPYFFWKPLTFGNFPLIFALMSASLSRLYVGFSLGSEENQKL